MKITIPENLREINIRQYQKFSKIVDENPDSEDFLAMKMVEIFCDIPFKDVQNIPVNDMEEIVLTLNNTFESKRKFRQRIHFKGIEYGFIPDLENMSFGEYVDLNKYLESTEDLHRLMAVLYRPITMSSKDLYAIEKYDPSPTKDWIMLDFPLDVALEAQVFFYNLANALLMNLGDYLEKEQATIKNKPSGKSGDGISRFMRSLKVTCSNLIGSQN